MAQAIAAPTLRPMTVADLVDEIFRLYRANFSLLFALAAIVWLPASIVYLVLDFAFLGGLQPQRFSFTETFESGFVIAIAGLVGLIAFPVLFGGLTAAVSARHVGRPITVDASVRRGLACYWRVTVAYLLVFLVILVVVLTPIAIALAAGFLISTGRGPGILVALAFAAVIGALVATVWLTVTWAFVGQAIVIEDVPLMRSFGRSRALASGSRWRIIGINLLLSLIGAVLFSVPSAIVALIAAPLPGSLGAAVSQLVASLAQIAFYPVQFGTLTLLYYDLRVRKEAFDLTLAAERLPAK